MIEREAKEELEKEGYRIIGKHSAVKICRWTKKSLIDEGVCYKQKFYGIDSHRCCQMSCTLFHCENKCIHCWRNLKYTKLGKVKNPDDPKKIIDACISKQKKLLMGFKGNDNVNMKKFEEAQEPMQFAISLIGEALNYPKIGEFIYELTKRGKTSFLVSNGLNASVLQELGEKDCLPTQLYISMNVPDKELFDRWHNSSVDSAWDKFNESLDVLKSLKNKTRTVLRMTLVKDKNMLHEHVKGYVDLISKARPDFVEVKGFVSVGFSRQRLGYDMMPTHEEIKEFGERLVDELRARGLKDYKVLDEHEVSKIVLIGDGEKERKI